MKYLILAALTGFLYLTSCAQPPPKLEAPPPPERPMDSISDRSLKEAFDDNYWITRPQNQTITIVGIANRNANKDKAIEEALADAAKRANLYGGVYGEATTTLMEGSNMLDYYANMNYTLDVIFDPKSCIDSLMFDPEKDVYQKEGSVFIRTKYSGIQNIPPYKSEMRNGMPDWVFTQEIDIPGFMVGIGVSKNKGTVQKTYIASYEIALVSLIANVSSKTTGKVTELEGAGKLTQNVTKSRGTLTDVMILETWYDTKSKAVWTLLVAKAAKFR